eukprot:scaffold23427_cov68-Phaeocystis_antarctica.AAC.3
MHEEEEAAGWGGGGCWQWEGRRCSSARQALAASSSSVMRECRSNAEISLTRSQVPSRSPRAKGSMISATKSP